MSKSRQLPTCACSAACSVNEQLWFCWEVIVDHIVQEWQVNATGSHIGDYKDGCNARSEFAAVDTPGYLRTTQRCDVCVCHSSVFGDSLHEERCKRVLLHVFARLPTIFK